MKPASENPCNGERRDSSEIPHPHRERIEHRRQKPPVDAAMGVGCPAMSLEEMTGGLARLVTKGVRTATVYKMGGMPVVMTRDLPDGVFALRSNNRITAYRDGKPILTLPIIVAPAA